MIRNPRKKKLRIIGRREYIDLPQLYMTQVEAKIDTGAYTSSLHCETLYIHNENSSSKLYFTTDPAQTHPFEFENFTQKKIKNSFGEMEERYVIKTRFRIGKKIINASVSLTSRDNMRYPVLIGRRILKGKFLIDPLEIHTGGLSLKTYLKQ